MLRSGYEHLLMKKVLWMQTPNTNKINQNQETHLPMKKKRKFYKWAVRYNGKSIYITPSICSLSQTQYRVKPQYLV